MSSAELKDVLYAIPSGVKAGGTKIIPPSRTKGTTSAKYLPQDKNGKTVISLEAGFECGENPPRKVRRRRQVSRSNDEHREVQGEPVQRDSLPGPELRVVGAGDDAEEPRDTERDPPGSTEVCGIHQCDGCAGEVQSITSIGKQERDGRGGGRGDLGRVDGGGGVHPGGVGLGVLRRRTRVSLLNSIRDKGSERILESDTSYGVIFESGECDGHTEGPTVVELFCQARLNVKAEKYGGRMKSDDKITGYDLSKRSVQDQVRKEIEDADPYVLSVAVPCSQFSALQNLSKWKGDLKKKRSRKNEAVKLLRYALVIAKDRIDKGKHVVWEHPVGASSWARKDLQKAFKGLYEVVFHQRMFGLKVGGIHVRKGTRIVTTNPCIAYNLNKKCDGCHKHRTIEGSFQRRNVSEMAQKWPSALVRAILRSGSPR